MTDKQMLDYVKGEEFKKAAGQNESKSDELLIKAITPSMKFLFSCVSALRLLC